VDAGYNIGLVCIVIKYPRVLDESYLELLRMYRRLLGKHLDANLQVVFTDCSGAKIEEELTMAREGGGSFRSPSEKMEGSEQNRARAPGIAAAIATRVPQCISDRRT
jgi:hypothetical protein